MRTTRSDLPPALLGLVVGPLGDDLVARVDQPLFEEPPQLLAVLLEQRRLALDLEGVGQLPGGAAQRDLGADRLGALTLGVHAHSGVADVPVGPAQVRALLEREALVAATVLVVLDQGDHVVRGLDVELLLAEDQQLDLDVTLADRARPDGSDLRAPAVLQALEPGQGVERDREPDLLEGRVRALRWAERRCGRVRSGADHPCEEQGGE